MSAITLISGVAEQQRQERPDASRGECGEIVKG